MHMCNLAPPPQAVAVLLVYSRHYAIEVSTSVCRANMRKVASWVRLILTTIEASVLPSVGFSYYVSVRQNRLAWALFCCYQPSCVSQQS